MGLIVHAVNIHSGGGRTLLLNLLCTLKIPTTVQVDSRLDLPSDLSSNLTVIRVVPTWKERLKAEWRLISLCKKGDKLLCFGNLPPLFPVSASVFVFLQNQYLLNSKPLAYFTIAKKIRIHLERLLLRYCLREAILFVQTETMVKDVKDNLDRKAFLLPFFENLPSPSIDSQNLRYDYIYVASGEPHKNHIKLLKAWILLAEDGIKPSLLLTLNTEIDARLLLYIKKLSRVHDLQIQNQITTPDKVANMYAQSGALIYPSLFESYGLPLLEARQLGIDIIASERDYVRDVVTPDFTFDPQSEISIARAVIRHQGINREPIFPDSTADALKKLMAFN